MKLINKAFTPMQQILAVTAIFALVINLLTMAPFARAQSAGAGGEAGGGVSSGEQTTGGSPSAGSEAGGQVWIFSASVSPSSIDAGETVPFSFTITNDVTSSADIKSARIFIPVGFTASNLSINNSLFQVKQEVNEIRISQKPGEGNDGLPPSSSFIVVADITNSSGSGSTSWTVCAYKNNSFTPAGGADFKYENGDDCGSLTIRINQTQPTVDVAITKLADDTTPDEGTDVVYTIAVTNNGTGGATGVVVTDPLASGLSYVSATIPPNSTSPLTWNVGTLASGATWSVDVTATVGSDEGGSTITNTATANLIETDTNPTNNSASETIDVQDITATLTVEKEFVWGDSDPIYGVDNFTYYVSGDEVTEGAENTLAPGIYTVSEQGEALVDFETTFGGACSDTGSVTLEKDDNKTCTIINTYSPNITRGTLQVKKIVLGSDADPSEFSFKIDGGNAVAFESDGQNDYVLTTGTYTITEVENPDYNTSYDNCIDVMVTDGGTAVCTITNTKKQEEPKTCSITLVSGEDNNENYRDDFTTVVERGNALAYIVEADPAWLPITGAGWIWGDATVQNPEVGETQTFERKFGFLGNVTNATLIVSSDDAHSASVTGSFAGSKPTASHVSGQGVYDVTSSINESGNNEISIEVTNIGTGSSWNPAGLAFKLVIEGEVTTDDDCLIPYQDTQHYTLDVTITGDGTGEVTSNDEGVMCRTEIDGEEQYQDCSETYEEGAVVTLVATPDEGSNFNNSWTTGAGTCTGNNTPCTVTMNSNISLVAHFAKNSNGGGGGGGGGSSSPSPRCDAFALANNVLSWETRNGYDLSIAWNGLDIYSTSDGATVKAGTLPTVASAGDTFELTVERGRKSDTCSLSVPAVLGEVLGESITMPVGAPNTGAGGTSKDGTLPLMFALLGMFASLVTIRATRHG